MSSGSSDDKQTVQQKEPEAEVPTKSPAHSQASDNQEEEKYEKNLPVDDAKEREQSFVKVPEEVTKEIAEDEKEREKKLEQQIDTSTPATTAVGADSRKNMKTKFKEVRTKLKDLQGKCKEIVAQTNAKVGTDIRYDKLLKNWKRKQPEVNPQPVADKVTSIMLQEVSTKRQKRE